MQVLRITRECGCSFDDGLYMTAAEHGSLNVIQYLYEENDKKLCRVLQQPFDKLWGAAIRNGDMPLLDWIYANGVARCAWWDDKRMCLAYHDNKNWNTFHLAARLGRIRDGPMAGCDGPNRAAWLFVFRPPSVKNIHIVKWALNRQDISWNHSCVALAADISLV